VPKEKDGVFASLFVAASVVLGTGNEKRLPAAVVGVEMTGAEEFAVVVVGLEV